MGGPCGSTSKRVEKGMAALFYLTENYKCGSLTVKHLQSAVKSPKGVKKVAEYVEGTTVGHRSGCRQNWCWAPRFKTVPAAKRLAYFTAAIKNKFITPENVIERRIVNHPKLKHLFRKTVWVCGWSAVTFITKRSPKRHPYPKIEIQTYKSLTKSQLADVKKLVVKLLSKWAGVKFDSKRVTVKLGPVRSTTIYNTNKRDRYGMYQTHRERIPTIVIEIKQPTCVGNIS